MTSRLIIVALLSLLSVALWAPDLARPFGHPLGSPGFTAGRDGRIVAVDAGSPAERAGLRPGQRIDWRGTPLESRIILVDSASNTLQPIQRFPVRVQTAHGALMAVVTSDPQPGTDFSTALPRDLFALLLTLAAIALVVLRPSKAAWGFLIFALFGRGAPVNEMIFIGPAAYRIAATIVFEPLASAASSIGLVVFALYVLVENPLVRWRRMSEAGAYVAGIAIAALSTWSTVSTIVYGIPIAAVSAAGVALEIAVEIAVPVILFVNYNVSAPIVRERLRWVLLGLTVNAGIVSIIDFTSQAVTVFVALPYWLYPALSAIDSVVLTSTVLYAMFHERVLVDLPEAVH
jgi:hypothetical protein